MADPFVAEIRIFPFTFPPKGWAFCDGQLMPISQNTALFSLLGTVYGGDGKSTFALPDLRGSAAMHPDDNNFPQGAQGGSQTVTLLQSEIPAHIHSANASSQQGITNAPKPTNPLARATEGTAYQGAGGALVQMDPTMVAPAGGSSP
ncbi:MAG TPA: tail fiber protein, partial [Actinomycetota bacterium]|nr:tail fiber protein [Actinomycetota bacterium]